jgi:thioester reductase-like protein
MKPKEIKIGTRMEDGCLYAGISPSTGEPMYVAPADEKKHFFTLQLSTPEKARERAAKKSRQTGKEYHVPTRAELQVIFNNRAAIGGFNESGKWPRSWYRSFDPGTERPDGVMQFSTGDRIKVSGDSLSAWGRMESLRLVRN